MNKVLYILRGLPGSGKSTVANSLTSTDRVFEADKYFYDSDGNYNFDGSKLGEAHAWCKEQVEFCMMPAENGETNWFPNLPIVVSNTNTTEKEFKPYVELAEKYGYAVVFLVVENRHGNKSLHDVPEASLDKMEKRFQIKLR